MSVKNQFFTLVKLLFISLLIAVATGTVVAFFLYLLEFVTQYRNTHKWLLYFLPIAGIAIVCAYKYWGKNSDKGNNLIIDAIYHPETKVPIIMVPLVLLGTVVTHLFGGSAGREGTAVQIGGALAARISTLFRLSDTDQSIIITAGIAAGFAAVFGTPVTGFIFALEVLSIGRLQYKAVLPALLAAVTANVICLLWGTHHTLYTVQSNATIVADWQTWFKIAVCGIAFGWAAFIFSEGMWRLKSFFTKIIRVYWLIPVVGAFLIIALQWIVGDDYLGLGVQPNKNGAVSITTAFQLHGAHTWSWLWKIIFTVVTLAAGFKGGEVTPLFFIGAMLGNVLAPLVGLPTNVLAAVGFVAVFAGATNTPLACTLMGVELFGGQYILLFAIGNFIAYFFSGHSGIYSAQTISNAKIQILPFEKNISLAEYIQLKKLREKKWRESWQKRFRRK